jgi:hypothetical protein
MSQQQYPDPHWLESSCKPFVLQFEDVGRLQTITDINEAIWWLFIFNHYWTPETTIKIWNMSLSLSQEEPQALDNSIHEPTHEPIHEPTQALHNSIHEPLAVHAGLQILVRYKPNVVIDFDANAPEPFTLDNIRQLTFANNTIHSLTYFPLDISNMIRDATNTGNLQDQYRTVFVTLYFLLACLNELHTKKALVRCLLYKLDEFKLNEFKTQSTRFHAITAFLYDKIIASETLNSIEKFKLYLQCF